MISGVLTLAKRSIRTIMAPRGQISWVDCDSDPAEIRSQLLETPHSLFPVGRGSLDNVLGVMRAKDQGLGEVMLVSPDDEYATIAGLLLAQHEELPGVGESFVTGTRRFEVHEMSDRRIELVSITRA